MRNESKEIGAYHAELLKMSFEENSEQWRSLTIKGDRTQTIMQLDFESFIMFSRIFMDKVAKLIEQMIKSSNGKNSENFGQHKEWIKEHKEIHPEYSKYLEEKTYWYERDLRLYRNKVVVHSGTLTSGTSVSVHTGVGFIRSVGVSPLRGENKETFLIIKREYEKRDPRLKILENDYEMLTDFVLAIAKHDIRLDGSHLEKLSNIVQTSGVNVSVDYLESIAKHIEDFLQETASIFKQ